LLENTDLTPASFLITNPDNKISYNTAFGSDSYGFWFNPFEHPTRSAFNTRICPNGMEVDEFK